MARNRVPASRGDAALAIAKINAVTGLITTIIVTLIKWGALVAIFYFGYLSIAALAGKTTMADIGLKLLGDVKVSETIAYIFGGGGIAYGFRQRQLRKQRIAELSGQIETLEKTIDPHRTSSTLPATGNTREDDRL